MSKRTSAAQLESPDLPATIPLAAPLHVGEIAVTLIDPEPKQPRRNFERGDKDGLLASVRRRGILQPLLLRPGLSADRYSIVCGERRFRAATAAGLETVPARVYALSDHDAAELGLLENIQRQDLHPMEEAETFARLQKLDPAYTDAALAERVGKSAAYVQRRKRLLSLPEIVREAFLAEAIQDAHAALIAKTPDPLKVEAFEECFLALDGRDVLRDRLKRRAWDELRPDVAAPASVQEFIDRHVKHEIAELQERLPELGPAVLAAQEAGRGLVELSADWNLSAQEKKRFPYLLGKSEFDEIGPGHYGAMAKTCDAAERGVITHAGRPALVMFCRKGNKCPVHHPVAKPSEPHARGGGKAAPSHKPTAYELAEKKRNAQQRQYALLKGAALRALAPVLVKATVTAEVVKQVLRGHQLAEISKRLGLTPSATNGVAMLLAAEALQKSWNRPSFAAFTKAVGFDLGKFEREEAKRKKAAKPAAKAKKAKATKKRRAA